MELRENVDVEGVPYKWTTNLDNDGIRDLYLLICADEDLHNRKPLTEGNDGSSAIRIDLGASMFLDTVPFRDGYCEVVGFAGQITVIYRTHDGWDRHWAKKKAEERREEEERQRRKEGRRKLRSEDRNLGFQIRLAIDLQDYTEAERIYRQRIELHTQARANGHDLGWWEVLDEGMDMYSFFPTAERGIEFILRGEEHPYGIQEFASRFLQNNRSAGDRKMDEVDRILRTGMDLFPSDGHFHAKAALFWRRLKDYDRAIEYCNIAISRGLSDHTASGFEGRLRRLRKEQARNSERG